MLHADSLSLQHIHIRAVWCGCLWCSRTFIAVPVISVISIWRYFNAVEGCDLHFFFLPWRYGRALKISAASRSSFSHDPSSCLLLYFTVFTTVSMWSAAGVPAKWSLNLSRSFCFSFSIYFISCYDDINDRSVDKAGDVPLSLSMIMRMDDYIITICLQINMTEWLLYCHATSASFGIFSDFVK